MKPVRSPMLNTQSTEFWLVHVAEEVFKHAQKSIMCPADIKQPPRNLKLMETAALGTYVSHGWLVLRAARDGNPEQRGRTRYQIRADIKTSVQSRSNHRKRVCKTNNSCLDSHMGSMKNYWHMQLYHTFSENSLGWISSLPRSVCTKRVLAHLCHAAGKKEVMNPKYPFASFNLPL